MSEDPKEFKLESKVPISGIETGRKRAYPFKKMKIGDSFFVEGKGAGNAARAAASKYARTAYVTVPTNDGGWTIVGKQTFLTRAEGSGVRIWRGDDEPIPMDRKVPIPGFPGKFFIIE